MEAETEHKTSATKDVRNRSEQAKQPSERSPAIHYHILWSDSALDWKPFATEDQATELAGKIKKPEESYTIVERHGDCERCKEFNSKGLSEIRSSEGPRIPEHTHPHCGHSISEKRERT
jgi:hypothetical protein